MAYHSTAWHSTAWHVVPLRSHFGSSTPQRIRHIVVQHHTPKHTYLCADCMLSNDEDAAAAMNPENSKLLRDERDHAEEREKDE